MCCNKTIAKWFLIIFNSIFFLLGAAILGIGAFVLADDSLVLQALSYVPTNDVVDERVINDVLETATFLESAAIAIIVLGSIIFVIGFCGCVGACKESKCLLGIYGALVLVIFLAQLTAGILAFIYQSKVETYMTNYLNGTLQYKYKGSSLDSNGDIVASDDLITSAWDLVQVQVGCCGLNGISDYEATENWNKTYLVGGSYVSVLVPATCCKLNGASLFPAGLSDITFVDASGCLENARSNATHTTGCYTTLKDKITGYATYIAGGAIGIGCLELFGVIAAFCLIRQIGKED